MAHRVRTEPRAGPGPQGPTAGKAREETWGSPASLWPALTSAGRQGTWETRGFLGPRGSPVAQETRAPTGDQGPRVVPVSPALPAPCWASSETLGSPDLPDWWGSRAALVFLDPPDSQDLWDPREVTASQGAQETPAVLDSAVLKENREMPGVSRGPQASRARQGHQACLGPRARLGFPGSLGPPVSRVDLDRVVSVATPDPPVFQEVRVPWVMLGIGAPMGLTASLGPLAPPVRMGPPAPQGLLGAPGSPDWTGYQEAKAPPAHPVWGCRVPWAPQDGMAHLGPPERLFQGRRGNLGGLGCQEILDSLGFLECRDPLGRGALWWDPFPGSAGPRGSRGGTGSQGGLGPLAARVL